MRKKINVGSVRYWFYWKLTILYDKGVDPFGLVDYLRDLTWEEW